MKIKGIMQIISLFFDNNMYNNRHKKKIIALWKQVNIFIFKLNATYVVVFKAIVFFLRVYFIKSL